MASIPQSIKVRITLLAVTNVRVLVVLPKMRRFKNIIWDYFGVDHQRLKEALINLLIRTLVGVALVEICLVASFFIDENNGTEDEDFGADAQERPQSGKLILDADESLGLSAVAFLHGIVITGACIVAAIAKWDFLDGQFGVLHIVHLRQLQPILSLVDDERNVAVLRSFEEI